MHFARSTVSNGEALDILRSLKAAADQPALLYLDVKSIHVTHEHLVVRTKLNTRNCEITSLENVPTITGKHRRFFWIHLMHALRHMSNQSVYTVDGANPQNWELNRNSCKPLFVGVHTLTMSHQRVRIEGLYEITLFNKTHVKETNPDRVFG
jgi:hypothetical protein